MQYRFANLSFSLCSSVSFGNLRVAMIFEYFEKNLTVDFCNFLKEEEQKPIRRAKTDVFRARLII